MRLGFVGNSALVPAGSAYSYRSGEWRYLERVAPLFDEVDICASICSCGTGLLPENDGCTHRLDVPNGRVHDLPDGDAEGTGQWVAKQIRRFRMLRGLCPTWDFAFAMMPSWTAPMIWICSRVYGFDYAVSVRGEWEGVAQSSLNRRPWLRKVSSLYFGVVKYIEQLVLRDAVIRMSSGLVLADRHPELADSMILTLNVKLRASQFHFRRDTCNGQPIKLIFVGSLVPRKGLDILLRSVADVIAHGFDVELEIAGEGPERTKLKELCLGLGIGERVTFHGYVEDGLLDLYRMSDVFVLASHSEGFPRVIYEAMSQSLPVVVTRVGGIPNLLETEETALLVEPGDVQSLTEGIERVITNNRLRQRLIKHGYDLAKRVVDSDPLSQCEDRFREALLPRL